MQVIDGRASVGLTVRVDSPVHGARGINTPHFVMDFGDADGGAQPTGHDLLMTTFKYLI